VAKCRAPGCIFKTWNTRENKIRMGARKRQKRNRRRVRESWDCQLKGIMLIMLIFFYLQFLPILFLCYSFFERCHSSFLWMKTWSLMLWKAVRKCYSRPGLRKMYDFNVFIICFIITTSGNMLSCQKNYVLREKPVKNRVIILRVT